jgi:hypothetical protein
MMSRDFAVILMCFGSFIMGFGVCGILFTEGWFTPRPTALQGKGEE